MQDIDEKIEECQEELSKLFNMRKERKKYQLLGEFSKEDLGETFWTCTYCQKKSKRKGITFKRNYGYTKPYSCSEGDYHTFVGYSIICPKCSRETSIDRVRYGMYKGEVTEEFRNFELIKKGFGKSVYFSYADGVLDKEPW